LSASAEKPAIDSMFCVFGSIRSSLPVRPAGASTRWSDGENIRSSNPMPPSPPGRARVVGFAMSGFARATVLASRIVTANVGVRMVGLIR